MRWRAVVHRAAEALLLPGVVLLLPMRWVSLLRKGRVPKWLLEPSVPWILLWISLLLAPVWSLIRCDKAPLLKDLYPLSSLQLWGLGLRVGLRHLSVIVGNWPALPVCVPSLMVVLVLR